jgi:hypothetical protein
VPRSNGLGDGGERLHEWVLPGAGDDLAAAGGLPDALELHLIPVLLGEGRRLFEHLGAAQRELERIRVLEGEGGVTHLRFRVRR